MPKTPPTVEVDEADIVVGDPAVPAEPTETAQDAPQAGEATQVAAEVGSGHEAPVPGQDGSSPPEEPPVDIAFALAKANAEAEAEGAPPETPPPETPPEPTPKEIHDAWCADKIANGWAYGQVFDERERTDPHLVHWDLLPAERRELVAEGAAGG